MKVLVCAFARSVVEHELTRLYLLCCGVPVQWHSGLCPL